METNTYTFFLPAFLLLIHCLVTHNIATNISTDQSALLAFRSTLINLDPSDHILSKNWSARYSASTVCNWIGVTCSRRHERVSALNVSNMRLEGNLNILVPQLGNLSFLVSLDLSSNNFKGTLPQELTRFRRLRVLNLNLNKIRGNIPSWLSNSFPQLQTLRLRNNTFRGVIPPSLSNISKLEYLDLSYNPLHGGIPQQIADLQNLKWLALQGNQLTGSIPPLLFNISKLEQLALARNMLSGDLPNNICQSLPRIEGLYLGANLLSGKIPANMSGCWRLKILGLSRNQLEGFIPKEIGGMPALEILQLGNNNLTGAVPSILFNISTLRILEFGDNQLNGNLPSDLGHGLPNLESLEFSSNNLSSESLELKFITSLENCRHLTKLKMANNPLNGRLPSSIGNLSGSLENIYAYRSGLKGSIPQEIGNLSGLITLSIFENQLTGSLPESLGNLESIQALGIGSNKLQGSIPSTLCELDYLYGLVLDGNGINSALPDCIGNLTSLRILWLPNNKLNSTIPKSLWHLKDLQRLSLSSNFFNGYLAPEIGNLKAATDIDLSMNQFSGTIPGTIGGLIALNSFNLDHNQFEGPIPESIAQMVSLEELDLSHNNLSGQIPPSMRKLQHLLYFNVSFNNLIGEIPSDGPFMNFSSQSFFHNKGLCGKLKYDVSCPTNLRAKSKRKLKLIVIVIPVAVSVIVLVLSLGYAFVKYQKKQVVSLRCFPWSIPTPLRFSYYELLEATEKYADLRLLGTGSFGSVYRATLSSGKDVAVKVFNLDVERAYKSFEVECKVLRQLRHKNLCKVIGSCSNQDFKALVLEYMPSGSLEKWLYSHNYFLDLLQRVSIMTDVASALEYLHYGYSIPIIHCDIKPSNILLDETKAAYLSDFGISKLLDGGESMTRTMTLATLCYIAPEFGMEGLVSTRCDVYSFGIMLMEVFTRMKPDDEMFAENLSLRSLVKDSMPNGAIHIVDSNLLKADEEWLSEKSNCLSSILELSLCCSMESPYERINIKDVRIALEKIKLQLRAYY